MPDGKLERWSGPADIAWCDEHGLHGARDRCFECDEPVEQIQMLPTDEIVAAAGKLYRHINNGNFAGDVHQRGVNEGMKRLLVNLGLRSAAEVDGMFRRLADEEWERSAEMLRKVNAEKRGEGP